MELLNIKLNLMYAIVVLYTRIFVVLILQEINVFFFDFEQYFLVLIIQNRIKYKKTAIIIITTPYVYVLQYIILICHMGTII